MRKYNITQHLNNEDLDLTFEKCPFCGTNQNQKKIGIIQKSPNIDALVCNNCHIGYANRQPTQVFLDQYYSNYYNYGEGITIQQETLVDHIVKLTKIDSLNEEVTILDFGGGDGSIGYGLAQKVISKKKIRVFVVDPNFKKRSTSSSEHIQIDGYSSIEELPNSLSFDLIIASAVLEHVKNPLKTLDKLLNLMKPKAKFYIRTPYLFPFKKIFNYFGYTLDMMYPGHLFDMGNHFWENSLKVLQKEKSHEVFISKTSLVESTFKESFVKTAIAYIFKFPSRFFGSNYHFVGG